MGSKKDKLLESAQKFIAKGQLDRAIKDYEQVVALDSGDIRHRQRLAELLVRANRKEEAIGQYEAIGKHYSDHAFFLKAIAVYKQIQKLDPGNVSITLNLASLNERQGLVGNALAEYNNALSYYQKTRQLPEAIKVLDQMLAADPGNLNTLLKFAETYHSAGVHEKSYDHFTKLAVHLGKSGDESAFKQICNRVADLFPDRKDFLLELMSSLVEDGDLDSAIRHLLTMTGNDNGNRRAWELLVEAYQRKGDHEQCTATLQRMVSLFPEETSYGEKLSKDIHDVGLETSAEKESVLPDVVSPEEPSISETSPAAIEEPIVPETDDSGHEVPWEEIDLDLADGHDVPELPPDADELPVCPGAVTAGGEPAPAAVENVASDSEESIPETPSLSDDFSEIDLEIDAEDSAGGVALGAQGADTDELSLADGFQEIELEVDEREATNGGVPWARGAGAGEQPLHDDFSEIDLADTEDGAESVVPEIEDAGVELPFSDDFSEIDLEIDTEDSTDSIDPELQDGDTVKLPPLLDDSSETDAGIDEEEAADIGVLGGVESLLYDDGSELDLEIDADGVVDGDVPEPLGAYTDDLPPDDGAELDLKVEGKETPFSLEDFLEETGPAEQSFSDSAASESEQTTEMLGEGGDADELFDLGAELRQVEPGEDSDSTESSKYSLGGLFSAFKEAVDQQLDQGDTETHYNLGIAYREMGLYDDAIAEFQAASRAAERTADCLTLQGICHRDKGDVDSAEAAFRKGMALEGLTREERLSLTYELALLLEGTGRMEESVQLYRDVRAVNPDFREVGSRIAAISGDEEAMAAEELELLELEEEE